jgi:hypothetical protein
MLDPLCIMTEIWSDTAFYTANILHICCSSVLDNV